VQGYFSPWSGGLHPGKDEKIMSFQTIEDACLNVIAQMEAVSLTGLTSADLLADGQLHRFRPGWEPKPSKKRAWYVLFQFRTDAGAELISGSFGWFKGAESYTYTVELGHGYSLSPAEKQRIEQSQAESRRTARLLRQEEAQAAADKALSIWNACGVNGHSAYLQRKKIAGLGCRYSRGSVVIPVRSFDGKLHGLQFIDAEGNKRFLTGTVKKGHFCPLASVNDPDGYMGITEGYATGCTAHMATGWPVFVAFDAGNLEHVAEAVRLRYPHSKIVLFADDDFDHPDNPGRVKAEAAARAVGGVAVLPPHRGEVA